MKQWLNSLCAVDINYGPSHLSNCNCTQRLYVCGTHFEAFESLRRSFLVKFAFHVPLLRQTFIFLWHCVCVLKITAQQICWDNSYSHEHVQGNLDYSRIFTWSNTWTNCFSAAGKPTITSADFNSAVRACAPSAPICTISSQTVYTGAHPNYSIHRLQNYVLGASLIACCSSIVIGSCFVVLNRHVTEIRPCCQTHPGQSSCRTWILHQQAL